MDIGIVSANGGAGGDASRRIPRVDIQPAWSRDGKSLYFTSARAADGGSSATTSRPRADTQVVQGIQPAVSPDGTRIAYEQRGLRVLDLATGDIDARARRGDGIPDGAGVDAGWPEHPLRHRGRGSNDIRIIPAAGGDPIELTVDTIATRCRRR